MPVGHRFSVVDAVPVATLAQEPLLLAEDSQAPEFNQFVVDMCRSAGFTPAVYDGTVESIRAAADLVAQGRCLYCVPPSCITAPRHHLAAADRARVVLSMVGSMASGGCLRAGAGYRRLRAGHVAPAGLAPYRGSANRLSPAGTGPRHSPTT